MALAGVSDVYSASSNLFRAFLQIDVSPSQVYRVSTVLGHQITLDLQQDVAHPELVKDEVVYASMDGSMIFTDKGWQEVKVGRVFSSSSRVEAGQKGDSETRFKLKESTFALIWGLLRNSFLSLKPVWAVTKPPRSGWFLSPMAGSGFSSIWNRPTPKLRIFLTITMR